MSWLSCKHKNHTLKVNYLKKISPNLHPNSLYTQKAYSALKDKCVGLQNMERSDNAFMVIKSGSNLQV